MAEGEEDEDPLDELDENNVLGEGLGFAEAEDELLEVAEGLVLVLEDAEED